MFKHIKKLRVFHKESGAESGNMGFLLVMAVGVFAMAGVAYLTKAGKTKIQMASKELAHVSALSEAQELLSVAGFLVSNNVVSCRQAGWSDVMDTVHDHEEPECRWLSATRPDKVTFEESDFGFSPAPPASSKLVVKVSSSSKLFKNTVNRVKIKSAELTFSMIKTGGYALIDSNLNGAMYAQEDIPNSEIGPLSEENSLGEINLASNFDFENPTVQWKMKDKKRFKFRGKGGTSKTGYKTMGKKSRSRKLTPAEKKKLAEKYEEMKKRYRKKSRGSSSYSKSISSYKSSSSTYKNPYTGKKFYTNPTEDDFKPKKLDAGASDIEKKLASLFGTKSAALELIDRDDWAVLASVKLVYEKSGRKKVIYRNAAFKRPVAITEVQVRSDSVCNSKCFSSRTENPTPSCRGQQLAGGDEVTLTGVTKNLGPGNLYYIQYARSLCLKDSAGRALTPSTCKKKDLTGDAKFLRVPLSSGFLRPGQTITWKDKTTCAQYVTRTTNFNLAGQQHSVDAGMLTYTLDPKDDSSALEPFRLNTPIEDKDAKVKGQTTYVYTVPTH